MKMSRIIFALLLTFSSYSAFAEAEKLEITVNKKIEAFMSAHQIPGAAVQIFVDGLPHTYYYGYANKEKKSLVTSKTIFEIGSISKVMSGILLAQEVDYAKMGFSDSITKYFPNLPENYNEIQLKHLATHTAGFALNAPKNVTNPQELATYLTNHHSDFATGDQWEFSNIGIGLLANALENETKWDFNKLYLRHIALPLKMEPIGLTVSSKLMKYYAQGYDATDKPVAHNEAGLFPSAYNIKMAAADMQPFLSAAIGFPQTPARVLWPMRMSQSIFIKYNNQLQGLGWLIHPIKPDNVSELLSADLSIEPKNVDIIYDRPTYDANALIDQTGATPGFRAYIAFIPNKKTGIMILINKRLPNNDLAKMSRELLFELNQIT